MKRKWREKARAARDEEESKQGEEDDEDEEESMQGAEASAREGAFHLDLSDEQALSLHDLLPEAYRSKERYSKTLKDLVKNLNRNVFITQEELPEVMMTTQHLHTGEEFRTYLKKNNL